MSDNRYVRLTEEWYRPHARDGLVEVYSNLHVKEAKVVDKIGAYALAMEIMAAADRLWPST